MRLIFSSKLLTVAKIKLHHCKEDKADNSPVLVSLSGYAHKKAFRNKCSTEKKKSEIKEGLNRVPLKLLISKIWAKKSLICKIYTQK